MIFRVLRLDRESLQCSFLSRLFRRILEFLGRPLRLISCSYRFQLGKASYSLGDNNGFKAWDIGVYMKITIAGLPGSGKTTVGKMIAKALDYEHYSIGDLRGEIALKHNMSMAELNEVGLKEIWPHKEADDFLEELGKTKDKLVIDTWLGWHFVPDSFKVFVSVDADAAANRIFGDLDNRPDEDYDSVEEVLAGVQKRVEKSDQAYQKHYGISFLKQSNYDLILDSTNKTPEEIVEEILGSVPNEGS